MNCFNMFQKFTAYGPWRYDSLKTLRRAGETTDGLSFEICQIFSKMYA